MKTRSITFLLLIIILVGCSNDADIITGTYSSMHFVRQGGGSIDFRLSPTSNPNQLQAIVSNYNYRDTTIRIVIDSNVDSAPYFIAFKKALSSEIDIAGDFQQPTLPTGTWAFVYVSCNGKDTEVTNAELRNTLLTVEQLVVNKIQ
jgi:uncharacterized lipoprotein NlpE involved in copper resistance